MTAAPMSPTGPDVGMTAPAPTRPRGNRSWSRTLVPLSFITPTFILFCVFFVWPATLGLAYSFTRYSGVGSPSFIGLSNYQQLFGDGEFYSAISRTLLFTAIAVPAHYIVGLGIAMLLVGQAKGKAVAKVVFFLPWLVSSIVAGVIWRWLFGENFGFVNYVLGLLGVPALHWQTGSTLALGLIVIASTWGGTAFNLLLFVAALRNIPTSYLEAAAIDGAGAWTRFWRIQLPLLAPTSFMVVLLSTIGSMKEFALIQTLNGGGPGTSNQLIVQYIYRTGFERAHIGYASSASMVLMLILVAITLIQMRFDRRSALA